MWCLLNSVVHLQTAHSRKYCRYFLVVLLTLSVLCSVHDVRWVRVNELHLLGSSFLCLPDVHVCVVFDWQVEMATTEWQGKVKWWPCRPTTSQRMHDITSVCVDVTSHISYCWCILLIILILVGRYYLLIICWVNYMIVYNVIFNLVTILCWQIVVLYLFTKVLFCSLCFAALYFFLSRKSVVIYCCITFAVLL